MSKGGRPGSNTTVTSPKDKDRRTLDEKQADRERKRKQQQDEKDEDVNTTASTSRFAHWADMAPPAAAVARPPVSPPAPLTGYARVAADRAAVVAISQAQTKPVNGPVFATAEAAARSALAIHAEVTTTRKAAGKPAPDTAEALADQAVANARRLGIIK